MTAPAQERSWTNPGRPKLTRQGRPAPAGPWWDEPDKVQWVDPATDLDCLAVRNPFGASCGYVGLPPGHPWHGKGYGEHLDPDCTDECCWTHTPEALVDVHGGLTFADSCDEDAAEGHGICHVPFPGRPTDVWWLGFDCAHAGDYSPGLVTDGFGGFPGDVYRDLGYVRAEVASLAAQLATVTATQTPAAGQEGEALPAAGHHLATEAEFAAAVRRDGNYDNLGAGIDFDGDRCADCHTPVPDGERLCDGCRDGAA